MGSYVFTRYEHPSSLYREPTNPGRIHAVNSSKLKQRIRTWALEAGFDFAGFAPLGPSRHREFFEAWLARGDHAEMAYLERRVTDRLDPRELVAEAKSVLSVGLRYHPIADERPAAGDLWPFVARYARGEDYHHVMQARLEQLAGRIESDYPGIPIRAYVDTGPVLERELAERAGIGAVGKNTNLLHPEFGSWFLLGELFLNLDLEADPAIADLCGSCSECLEACPTDALPQPYHLDSTRCISFWTIENRGPTPPEVRPQLGQWVFGCDICQEVCPLNEEPSATDHTEFRLPSVRGKLDLIGLLQITREEYVEVFRRSPMKRAKQSGLRRNAAIAMGNSRNPVYLPALETALQSDEALLRSHAAWAIGRIGGPEALACLEKRIPGEDDEEVLQELRAAASVCLDRDPKEPGKSSIF
jgi:epoxyqueuosine reductase